MHRLALALCLTGLCAPAFAQEHTGADDTTYIRLSPAQIAEIFCISLTGNDFAPIQSLVSPDLQAAIAEADAKDDAYVKANPGEMPPLGDGIPWTDAPDYSPKCTVGKVTRTDERAEIAIAHAFPDYPDADFTDHLVLKLVLDPSVDEKLWRIDNVTYREGDSDLRTVLKTAFTE